MGRIDRIDQFIDSNANGQQNGSERFLATFDYDYDLNGNRTSALEKFNLNLDVAFETVQRFHWRYDGVGRLTEEAFDLGNNGAGAGDYADDFYFDLAGNRVKKTRDVGGNGTVDETTSYFYDANDRLNREELNNDADATIERTTTYTYDNPATATANDGTSQARKQVTGDVAEDYVFSYDDSGRLKQSVVTKSGQPAVTTTYKYDDAGLRVRSAVGAETIYVNDAANQTGFSGAGSAGTRPARS